MATWILVPEAHELWIVLRCPKAYDVAIMLEAKQVYIWSVTDGRW